MDNNLRIAGVVLAGGQSTRMGTDKAQLTLDDQSLLNRAVTLLHESGIQDVFVSGDYPTFNCILDDTEHLGPISGLQAASNKLSLSYDAIFVIPVDMPLLPAHACSQLLELFINHVGTHQTGVYHQPSMFPMILGLNQQLTTYLKQALSVENRKQRSVYRLLQTLNIKPVQISDVEAFFFDNTNTPSEWERCKETFQILTSQQHLSSKE